MSKNWGNIHEFLSLKPCLRRTFTQWTTPNDCCGNDNLDNLHTKTKNTVDNRILWIPYLNNLWTYDVIFRHINLFKGYAWLCEMLRVAQTPKLNICHLPPMTPSNRSLKPSIPSIFFGAKRRLFFFFGGGVVQKLATKKHNLWSSLVGEVILCWCSTGSSSLVLEDLCLSSRQRVPHQRRCFQQIMKVNKGPPY